MICPFFNYCYFFFIYAIDKVVCFCHFSVLNYSITLIILCSHLYILLSVLDTHFFLQMSPIIFVPLLRKSSVDKSGRSLLDLCKVTINDSEIDKVGRHTLKMFLTYILNVFDLKR